MTLAIWFFEKPVSSESRFTLTLPPDPAMRARLWIAIDEASVMEGNLFIKVFQYLNT
jgi:hypothetical protein